MNQKSKLTFGKIFERFAYGCGDFGCNIIYTAMSAFLLFYYTDYAGVSAMAVGTIMMISRVFDGISDIIMGVIVDRTHSRLGKARPWILRMCIPFAISGVLMFSVPASWSSTPKLVYVFITYNLVSTIIYTAINVPYSALNALMTQDPYERSVLSIFRNLLATAGTLTINTFTLPLVEYFGNNASAWTKTFVVFGIVSIAAFLCTFFGTKERVRANEAGEQKVEENVPFVTGIKALFQNKYWIMMTGMLALFFLMYSVNGGATMWAMVSDTIDYGEWKTGYRTEGLVNSACSFGYKIGNGIGSALLGVILEVGGYVGNAAAQTASALTSIRICFVWIPIAVYVCGLIIMKFYHLDKEFDGIIADLKARK